MSSKKFRVNTNGQSLRNPNNEFFGMTLSSNLTLDESENSAHHDRRSAHNALERQRREHLNIKFQQLAHALPSLQTVRRPSKTMIVAKSLEFVTSSLKRESNFNLEIQKLKKENERLKDQAQFAMSQLKSQAFIINKQDIDKDDVKVNETKIEPSSETSVVIPTTPTPTKTNTKPSHNKMTTQSSMKRKASLDETPSKDKAGKSTNRPRKKRMMKQIKLSQPLEEIPTTIPTQAIASVATTAAPFWPSIEPQNYEYYQNQDSNYLTTSTPVYDTNIFINPTPSTFNNNSHHHRNNSMVSSILFTPYYVSPETTSDFSFSNSSTTTFSAITCQSPTTNDVNQQQYYL